MRTDDLNSALAAVEQELVETSAELGRAREIVERTSQRAETIRSLMGPLPTYTEIDSLHDLGARFRVTTSDPPTGAIASLLTSGLFSEVENGDLRARLSGWPARLENYRAVEGYLNDDIRTFERRAFEMSLSADSPFPHQGESLLTDPWFWNQAGAVLNATRYVLRDNVTLAEEAQDLRERISEYLRC